MKRLIPALLLAPMLSGCLPFAWFASSEGYGHYQQSHGTYIASSTVNTSCISPRLRLAIATFEGHFGRKIVMQSGYRDPVHNGKVGGADNSFHMKCMAADIFIPGVDKRQFVAFAKRNGVVGGLGCYPGRHFIHIDVRDRPRGWTRPVTFSGC